MNSKNFKAKTLNYIKLLVNSSLDKIIAINLLKKLIKKFKLKQHNNYNFKIRRNNLQKINFQIK